MNPRPSLSPSTVIFRWDWALLVLLCSLTPAGLLAGEPLGPEATLRRIVEANAARDLATLSKYMSHDADAVGYTIDGHKYVGWPDLEAEMRTEFHAVDKLELPITALQVWQKGEVAWFAKQGSSNSGTTIGFSSRGTNPHAKRILAWEVSSHTRRCGAIAPVASGPTRPTPSI